MNKFKKVMTKLNAKMHGDSQLVVALILIIVAIGICFIFRSYIVTTMSNAFRGMDSQINSLLAGTAATRP